MVRVSEGAVALLEENREAQGIPESQGVRIYGEGDPQGGLIIRMAFVDDPEEGDEQLEEHDTQFFVAAEVTEPLADVTIDVTEQEPPQLVLRREEPTG